MQLCILVQASLKLELFPTPDLTPWGHWSLHDHFQDKGRHEYHSQRPHDFADIFSKSKASKLADHWPYNLKITLDEGTSSPYGPIYSLSQEELAALHKFIDENLATG